MRHLSLLVIATLLLSACGFHLRGAGALGDSISNVYVSSDNIHAPLSRTLRDRLKSHKVALLDTPEEQATILYLHPEKMDRSLLSLFSTGQVAEYELNYQVTFEVKLPGQEARLYSFDLSREYQDDPNAVLAKSREMNLILDEMRKQAADRIIRQLGQLSQTPL
ncbi:LPS assembly lipoprotein LptE [Bowmanella denitrificans]|uniref:LPS-assembly lipoprotein LptE n=1 Tax=Bowmanella denitrificans TaxID=366582 RepID=UPI000C9A117E|nr:LPS assembly lipoprotein LptE [Bowmanella denitrificans]